MFASTSVKKLYYKEAFNTSCFESINLDFKRNSKHTSELWERRLRETCGLFLELILWYRIHKAFLPIRIMPGPLP